MFFVNSFQCRNNIISKIHIYYTHTYIYILGDFYIHIHQTATCQTSKAGHDQQMSQDTTCFVVTVTPVRRFNVTQCIYILLRC